MSYTGRMGWMANRKWRETKQQPSMLPGPAVPGCCLVSFHFLWAILCPQAVSEKSIKAKNLLGTCFPKNYITKKDHVYKHHITGTKCTPSPESRKACIRGSYFLGVAAADGVAPRGGTTLISKNRNSVSWSILEELEPELESNESSKE